MRLRHSDDTSRLADVIPAALRSSPKVKNDRLLVTKTSERFAVLPKPVAKESRRRRARGPGLDVRLFRPWAESFPSWLSCSFFRWVTPEVSQISSDQRKRKKKKGAGGMALFCAHLHHLHRIKITRAHCLCLHCIYRVA